MHIEQPQFVHHLDLQIDPPPARAVPGSGAIDSARVVVAACTLALSGVLKSRAPSLVLGQAGLKAESKRAA